MRVARSPDDLMAGFREQRRDALAKEGVILRDDDPQTPSTRVFLPACGCSVGAGHEGIRQEAALSANPRVLRGVEHAVARILAETESSVEAYEATLKAIGEALGWELGAAWEIDPRDRRLRCTRIWNAEDRAGEFEALSRQLALPSGEGLPGRVLARGAPAWVRDVRQDANFPRADAARRAGLHAGFAFPLRSPQGVVGVMEFFSRELREPDARLLKTMDALGSQLGQFVARRHAEAESSSAARPALIACPAGRPLEMS